MIVTGVLEALPIPQTAYRDLIVVSPMNDRPWQPLIEAAVLAPSGDNTQPWRFVVDRDAMRIDFLVDERRDPSPMNAGQRMARLAVGAALENALRAGRHLGWDVETQPACSGALASLRIVGRDAPHKAIDPVILSRCTNRRPFDARPLSAGTIGWLKRSIVGFPEMDHRWVFDRSRIERLASLIGRADAAMLSDPTMRAAFLSSVRYDAAVDEAVLEGLCVGALELARAQRIALRFVSRVPDRVLKASGFRAICARAARHLVSRSSGLCVITEPLGTPASEIQAGRVLERAWLAMTEQAMAVQPMMSPAILENLVRRGGCDGVDSLDYNAASNLVKEFKSVLALREQDRLAFIMRFGFAGPPSARTGRRPLDDVMETRGTPTDVAYV